MLQDIPARLAHLDSVGIDHQVISWATTTGWDAVLTADQARPVWTAFNDDLASLVRQYPSRFSGYAAVTTADVDWSATELERAYTDLGLIGVVLPVGAFQTLDGLNAIAPIFDVTQKHKGIVFVHSGPAYPSIPGQTVLDTPVDDAPDLRFSLEWSATYARGIVTLTQTDFLNSYPDVTVQIAMLGGLGPFLFEALQTGNGATSNLRDSLRRIKLDASTSRGPHLLELAVASIGADHVLFGSDYGAVPNIAPVVDAVQRSRLTADEQHQIFVDNGRSLYAEHVQS
jgi:predicted TIM-barrel fold metal-dependent hydrolase